MATSKGIPLVWTKHLQPGKAKDDFELTLRNSTLVLGRLRVILQDRLAAIEDEELKEEFYEDENLTVRLARNLAKKKELRDILNLLNFF